MSQDLQNSQLPNGTDSGLSSDEETLQLWGHFQNALEELGQDRSKVGFLDVAVFGAQSSGKSSLLSTLSGLQLPTGTGSAVTKCPIRISVTDSNSSYMQMPGISNEQIPLPRDGNKPNLTNSIYSEALHRLSGGAMTPDELEVKVGRPGHLPLNIVDTPGLITNDVPEKAIVDQLINTVLAGSGHADRPLLPIMTGTGTDVDINNLRTNLVRGRAFITVFTHVDHLMNDQPKVKGLRKLITDLKKLGCLACFLVNVKNSVDWPEQNYQGFCDSHSEGSRDVYEDLLSMCGIPRLLRELQKRQMNHMLSQRQQLLSNLQRLSKKLNVQDYPKDDQEVSNRLRDVLGLIRSDLQKVHHEGRSSLMDNDESRPIPVEFQANVQADQTLKRFTDKAFTDAMHAVMSGWTEHDVKNLGNNTLMLNYHTHAWNKTIQGLSLVTNAEHALTTSGELMDILQNFVLWRAKIHFKEKHLSIKQFDTFLSEYCKDKATSLTQDFRIISQELFYTLPSIQASQIYLFFESQQKEVASLLGKKGDLVTALLHDSGQWNLPIALDKHNEEFHKDLEVAQRRVKLYAFFAVSNLVENLSRRMTFLIFAKTWDVMAPSSWTNAPLTSFDLEAAFQHYFGEKVSHADWIEPGQVQMQGKHEVVEALIGALKKFRSPEAGGKQPVYTHEKAQLVITAQTTSSPGPGRAPPSPQTEKPSCAPASEQAQRFEQPNPNTQQAYNQGPNHNYRPAAQAQSYAQDPQSFSQNQAGYQPAYAQAQGSPNYPYATPQQHARSPYPAAQEANDWERSSNSSESSTSKTTAKSFMKKLLH